MESSFGESFADVRAYSGPEAKAASDGLGARAYAVDNQIAFGTDPSKELVAHELTHVVQQRRGSTAVQAKSVSSKGDAHEQEADSVASVVASGGSARGLISHTTQSDVSRDVFDVLNVTGTGVGTVGRMVVANNGLMPLIDAMTDSIVRSPKYMLADIREMLKDHWLEIVQSMTAFIAIELGVAALIATPDPTMGTKIAALLLQALVLALMAYFAVEATTGAAEAGQLWWDTLLAAVKDPTAPDKAKIELASQYFAHLVLNLVTAISTTAGALGIAWRGFRTPEAPHGTVSQGARDSHSDMPAQPPSSSSTTGAPHPSKQVPPKGIAEATRDRLTSAFGKGPFTLADLDVVRQSVAKNPSALARLDELVRKLFKDPSAPTAVELQRISGVLSGLRNAHGSYEAGLEASATANNATAAARAPRAPFGDPAALAQLPAVRPLGEAVRAEVTAAAGSTKIVGLDRMVRALDRDLKNIVRNMETGQEEVTDARIAGAIGNFEGVRAELRNALSETNVVEVSKEVSGIDPVSGKSLSGEIDNVADNGERWIDVKNYSPFGLGTSQWADIEEQATRMLKLSKLARYEINGKSPVCEYSFPKGVSVKVADELRRMGLRVRGKEIAP